MDSSNWPQKHYSRIADSSMATYIIKKKITIYIIYTKTQQLSVTG